MGTLRPEIGFPIVGSTTQRESSCGVKAVAGDRVAEDAGDRVAEDTDTDTDTGTDRGSLGAYAPRPSVRHCRDRHPGGER